MSLSKKILLAEDEKITAKYYDKVLTEAGYKVKIVHNGLEALEELKASKYDALLTDWIMPKMNGIKLIGEIRKTLKPAPLIFVLTSLSSERSKSKALDSGADGFLSKPIKSHELIVQLHETFRKRDMETARIKLDVKPKDISVKPPFIGVAIATSTGGPPTVTGIFNALQPQKEAAFFIVQHGPEWMFRTYIDRINNDTHHRALIGKEGIAIQPGYIYVAPGNQHMIVENKTYKIKLNSGPKVNFVRPAADPLFRSVAAAFGQYSIGLVLTGLGRDGTKGAGNISEVKGRVYVQDPETAVAPYMPESALNSGIPCQKIKLQEIGKTLSNTIYTLSSHLKSRP